MTSEELTLRLRRLLFPPKQVRYRSYTEGQASLKVVVQQICATTARSSPLLRGEVLYVVHLLRRVILTQFQLLCSSEEIEKDIPYAYEEWKVICEAAESFNQHFAHSQKSKCACQHSSLSNGFRARFCRMNTDRLRLKFADFARGVLVTHSKRIITQLLHDPNPKTMFQMVKFESSFIRALLGTFATFTTFFREQKMAHVSEEAFSLAEEESEVTWLDCLIPGAQLEILRRSEHSLVAQLWNRVAAGVVASLQPLHSQNIDTISAKLMSLAQQEDMAYHAAAVKSLWYITTTLEQQKALSLWDSGFQNMLAASQLDTHKDFPAQQSTATTSTTNMLLTQTLLPTQRLSDRLVAMGTSSSRDALSVAQHIDLLNQSQLPCITLNASVTAIAVFLFQGLSAAFSRWKLRVIAQLLFVDGPMICRMFDVAISQAGHVCSPQFMFPPCSKLHMQEWSSCEGYSLTHTTKTKMKEALENACTTFHNNWSRRCANTLLTMFPCLKFWRSLGKTSHLRDIPPSGYCEVVIKQLLLPVIDTARTLPLEPQKAFVGLTVCSLMNEFRRIVTANKKTYRPAAGRQLLTDYRHILHWLKSEGLGLHRETTGLLVSLPSLLEIEHGLLLICGTADHFQLPATASSLRDTLLVATSNLTLFSEQAWYTTHDWMQCAV